VGYIKKNKTQTKHKLVAGFVGTCFPEGLFEAQER